jgi:ATP-dependent DNA helicase RecG
MSLALLFAPLSSLSRVGPSLSKYLSKLVSGDKILNLLMHKPMRLENISICPRLFEVQNDELVILKLKVEAHLKPENSRQPYKVMCSAPNGMVNLVFFKIFPSQIQKMPLKAEIAVLGHLQRSFVGRQMEFQISHPQEIVPIDQIEKLPRFNVVYPLVGGISSKFISQKIREVLLKITSMEEWLDEKLLLQKKWPSFVEALKNLHYLERKFDVEVARKRLAYDELLAWQIGLMLAKGESPKKINFVKSDKNLVADFLKDMPFEATSAQLKAIDEILAEMNSDKKMLRLLQGDVGSGKTVVAIAACLQAMSRGQQACAIVPITILAKQHFKYFSQFLLKYNLRVEMLISATTKKQKVEILKKLAAGEIDILISTHAVLEDDIKFKNLGLAIIDEQHRFGVKQRLKLVEKGVDIDVLLMSATPIPRSLMMGLYGDMDISVLGEKPKNRQKIETLVMSAKKSEELFESMKRALAKGEKIYWICPAIEEIEEGDEEKLAQRNLQSAKEKFRELSKIFGEADVAMIHGKMKESEKEKVMTEFALNGKILVATTVIEVGIDISDATIIIIENAENFGLAQLHQLRGRVGRSDKKSFCILLYGERFGVNGRNRLNILRESNDGFFIAEEDLKMRGSGELLGTKQSGFPEFKIADLSFDSDLLNIAHKNAQVILHYDVNLSGEKSAKYRDLMGLFDYDECLKMVLGG